MASRLIGPSTNVGPMGVVMLAPDWRVRPLDHLQWVIEKGDGVDFKLDGERWRPRAYCRTRGGLLCALSRLAPEIDSGPLASFPAMFEPNPHDEGDAS
jgi:hypothetical protein